MPAELILIRHGESEANVGRSSDVDCAMTEKGFEQARNVGQLLAGHDLSHFIALVSPYRRARQTAAEIAGIIGLTFAIDDGVREWGADATIDGQHYAQEPQEQLIERLSDFLRHRESQSLIVVSHAAPIAALTQLAWGEKPNTQGAFWEGIDNCCLRWLRITRNIRGLANR